jgi:hypothetical protein
VVSEVPVFGLSSGELFVVLFILIAVVSAPYWPRAGERIAAALSRDKPEQNNRSKDWEK